MESQIQALQTQVLGLQNQIQILQDLVFKQQSFLDKHFVDDVFWVPSHELYLHHSTMAYGTLDLFTKHCTHRDCTRTRQNILCLVKYTSLSVNLICEIQKLCLHKP